MRRRRALACAVVAVAALAIVASAAATFDSRGTAGTTLSSGTLAAPTGAAAAQLSCKASKPPQISVSWTASTSGFATGYAIKRGTTSGGPYTAIGTTAATATSFVDPSVTLAYSTQYVYVVVTTFNAWTAQSGAATVTTLSATCK